MIKDNIIQQLKERGLIAQITDEIDLIKKLSAGPISLYCGFDPTADSLHLGHLVPLLCLKRFQLSGHRPIVLIGGATALIGDPSFKTIKRKLNRIENIQEWIKKIKHQISLFLDFNYAENRAIIVNNYDWFNSMNLLTFLNNIGKYFSINKIINKEVIKNRLNRDDTSISFTEFSYNLLQGYDFALLNQKYGVTLQIGGSDQWGNIISGVNLTRRLNKTIVCGLTMPLITNSNGIKFSKTEDNAVWLDPAKTSPYKFYQFWINISDVDAYNFLKFFTFLSINTINTLKQENCTDYQQRRAQYILAEDMTRLVHGEKGLISAKRITANLFSSMPKDLTESDFVYLMQDGMPSVNLKRGVDLKYALVAANFVRSRKQAQNLISSNAVSINGEKQIYADYIFNDSDRFYGRYTLLCCGKKHYCLLNWY